MAVPEISEKQVSLIGKAAAIIAVVGLHVLALFPDTLYTSDQLGGFFIFLNQLARFSVPLFLALSGFGLARKYQNKSLKKRHFLWGRAIKLLPLYVLWTVILLASLYLSKTWSAGMDVGIIESLFIGNADYHLYFIPLIFQFYILFSLLLSKMSNRRQLLYIVGASGVLQVVWFALIRHLSVGEFPIAAELLSDQLQYRLVISWLFYFLLGVLLANINISKFRDNSSLAFFLAALIIGGLSWAVYDSANLIAETGKIIFATSFIRLPVFIYASGVIAGVLIFGTKLMNKIQKNIGNFLQQLGKYSYVIYLSHTLLLRIIDGVITEGPRAITLARASLLLVIGIVISITEMR